MTLKWSRQTSKNKSAVKRTNWMHCYYSNLQWYWNSSTFNSAFLSYYTKNLWKLITLIFDKFGDNDFWNNEKFLIFNEKILTRQIAWPHILSVDIYFVSLNCNIVPSHFILNLIVILFSFYSRWQKDKLFLLSNLIGILVILLFCFITPGKLVCSWYIATTVRTNSTKSVFLLNLYWNRNGNKTDYCPVRVNLLFKSDSTLHGGTNEKDQNHYLFLIEVKKYSLNSKKLLTYHFIFCILIRKISK